MVVKGLCISDIHFGLPASARIYDELKQVKEFIEKNELDVIHINGDFFDRKLSFSEPAALLAMQFFYDIRELCIKKKIKLRIIHGTLSHERNQTEMFNKFASKHLDMKVINTVSEEELFPGFNVLYVPEEYPVDADEFYAPYKTKEYSAIMMHGMWDFLAMNSMIEQANRTDFQTAPIFKFEDWKQCVPHGMIICGHIHSRHIYRKKIFYPGSFSAWDFTDLSERGFAYYTYDTDRKFYKVNFINNTLCPSFGTISLDDLGIDLENYDVSEFQEAVKLASEKYDNFRVDIDTNMLSAENVEILKKTYKDNGKIKIKILDKKMIVLNEEDDQYTRYEYIFRNLLSIEETIHKFIQEDLSNHEGADKITFEQIQNIIKEEE